MNFKSLHISDCLAVLLSLCHRLFSVSILHAGIWDCLESTCVFSSVSLDPLFRSVRLCVVQFCFVWFSFSVPVCP